MFLKEVNEQLIDAYKNQDYQFEELVRQISGQREMGKNPIFDVWFNMTHESKKNSFYSYQRDENAFEYKERFSDYDLAFRFIDYGDILLCSLEYSVPLFRRETIERISLKSYFSFIIYEPILFIRTVTIGDINIGLSIGVFCNHTFI